MDPAIATGQVRVAVLGEGACVDLALPTTLAIRELIPRIRATLVSGRDDDDLAVDDGGEQAGLRPYSLAPLGGAPFSLDATLEALAVDDGEQLLLCRIPPGPAAPPVVEDIADASAIHSASRFRPFTHSLLPAATEVAAATLAVLICGLAGYGWRLGYRPLAAAVFGGVAALAVLAIWLLSRRGRRGIAARVGLAATVPLALAAAAALPGDAAAPRVFLAAAVVLAWSLLMLSAGRSWVAAYTATVTLSAVVGLAAALRILCHLPYLTLGCGFLVLSLLVALNAPTLSAIWARFPLPNVPAPGEPTPPPSSLAQIEDLPRKTALSNAYQNGLIAASALLVVVGAVLTGWLPDQPPLAAWWLLGATVIVTVMRMRIWDSAIAAGWFLATPFLCAIALAVAFTATGHLVAGLYAVGAVAALTALLLGAALTKPRDLTIPQRRYLDLFENIVLITIVPDALWLVGLVSLVRNRGPL